MGEYFQTPSTKPVTDYQYAGSARRFEPGGTANHRAIDGRVYEPHSLLGTPNIAEHIYAFTDQ